MVLLFVGVCTVQFTSFMTQFMAAAGFHLHEVLDDLITLTQNKVRRTLFGGRGSASTDKRTWWALGLTWPVVCRYWCHLRPPGTHGQAAPSQWPRWPAADPCFTDHAHKQHVWSSVACLTSALCCAVCAPLAAA